MLLMMWGKRRPYTIFVRLKICAATMDINMEAFPKPQTELSWNPAISFWVFKFPIRISCKPHQPITLSETENDLERLGLLLWPRKCWNFRAVPHLQALQGVLLRMLSQYFTEVRVHPHLLLDVYAHRQYIDRTSLDVSQLWLKKT